MIFETERLIFREMEQSDLPDLCEILQDKQTMYAYEHAFSYEEVLDWFGNQLARYARYGFGLWAAVLKENGKMIGNIGLTYQKFKDTEMLEIGYLLNRKYWHMGYATEGAKACKKYAFEVLRENKVYSIIRDNNFASQAVAKANGMKVVGTELKHYYNMDMPHLVFMVEN